MSTQSSCTIFIYIIGANTGYIFSNQWPHHIARISTVTTDKNQKYTEIDNYLNFNVFLSDILVPTMVFNTIHNFSKIFCIEHLEYYNNSNDVTLLDYLSIFGRK